MQRYYAGIPNQLPARDDLGRFTARARIHCDRCQMLSINSIPCHETGCPNRGKQWDTESECWVRLVECSNCGFEYYDTASVCPECMDTQYCPVHETYNCTEYHEEE